MQQSLVREVIVVLLQLANLIIHHGIDVAIQAVGLDRLDQVADGELDLEILALQQSGLLGDVLLLHAHELLHGKRTVTL